MQGGTRQWMQWGTRALAAAVLVVVMMPDWCLARTSRLTEVVQAVRAHIRVQTRTHEGFLPVYDRSTGGSVSLSPLGIDEQVRPMGEALYAVGVRTADRSEEKYDLDFFVEQQPQGMVVIAAAIQHDPREERYTWAQDPQGMWYRKARPEPYEMLR
ncbi:MAG: hypothetical protein AB1505_32560 [Candidatus Latescibacterota bacterium]